VAVAFLLAPQILAVIGYEFVFGNWVAYVLAAISLVAWIVYLVIRFRGYAVRIAENGVTWTQGTGSISFGWSDVVRASLERKPNASQASQAEPTDGVDP